MTVGRRCLEFVIPNLDGAPIRGYLILMTTNQLTAETITADQIRALREESRAEGDDRQVDYCDVAMARYRRQNADGSDLVWPWNGQPADRDVARKVCADAINAARASDDDVTDETEGK